MISADSLMARAGKTFHRAARLLPRSVRTDVVLLYAFCRQVDDVADEPGVSVLERCRALDAIVIAFECGRIADLRAAGWAFASQGAMAEAAQLLVKAASSDAEQQQPQTREELLTYAFGVAGTVGLMMAYVLRARPEGFRAAIALGMAMQLSNITRDVAEDLQNGRVYLPCDLVTAQAVRHALIAADPVDTYAVLQATRSILAEAEALYEAAFDGISSLPWRVRWSILAAALCYREIGREVGRRGKLSWKHRVVIGNGRKLWLVALAAIRLLEPRFWLRQRERPFTELGPTVLLTIRQLDLA